LTGLTGFVSGHPEDGRKTTSRFAAERVPLSPRQLLDLIRFLPGIEKL
jgi:hypothetical protein